MRIFHGLEKMSVATPSFAHGYSATPEGPQATILAWYEGLALRRTVELAGAYGLLLFALARIATSSYQAFLYFRF